MFAIPQSKRDLPESQFEFTLDGETTYRIPKLQYLSLDFIEKADERGSGIQLVDVCAELGLDDAVALIKTLDAVQIGELALAWMKGSDTTPGESSASTD